MTNTHPAHPKKDDNIHPLLWVANSILLGIIAIVLIGGIQHEKNSKKNPDPVKKIDMTAFEHLSVLAKSFYILDVNSGQVMYERDATTPRDLASITKIMTAITATSIMPASEIITIDTNDLAQDGDNGLYSGESWNFKNLLDFSLIVSSNDGMYAIADAAGKYSMQNSPGPENTDPIEDFVFNMNKEATTLGLSSMHFTNPTGLDLPDNSSGNLGSAKDVSLLMKYALTKYPGLLEATKNHSEDISSQQFSHHAVNTDEAMGYIPNLIASKTGYTNTAGGNLTIAFDAGLNRPVIITLLDSTYGGRFTDMRALASSTLAYIRMN